jgi:uncharacterized damage-inducible protein DinB
MPRNKTNSPPDIAQVLLENYAANAAMNDLLLTHLDPQVWRNKPIRQADSESRTPAEIFAHMHNNRLRWLELSAPHIKRPTKLDPDRCTIRQTRAAHRRSAASCQTMLRQALDPKSKKRVTKFSRGNWAPTTWPAGATTFAYMFAHDAHHRGQIIMLARQLGFPLPDDAAYGIWHWEKLWHQSGFATRPR